MPATSRTFVKASILYLCLGAVLGALIYINRFIPLGPWVGYVRVTHIQVLIVGWLTQLILGVAWWLFPPLKIGLRTDAPLPVRRGQTQRGSEPLFWATFACLNAGILLRALFEPQVECAPEAIALNLVYADEAVLVIDKPAGLVMHPAAGNPDGTLQNALLHFDPGLAELPGPVSSTGSTRTPAACWWLPEPPRPIVSWSSSCSGAGSSANTGPS